MRGTLSLSVQSCCASGSNGLTCLRDPQTMQAFMWQEDLIGVAKFVTACLRKMSRWKARSEGGTQTRHMRVKHLISLVWLEEM